MEERRKVLRHRTLKAGHIAVNRAGTIDCRVRNLSPLGAYWEIIAVPDLRNACAAFATILARRLRTPR